ncbi:MAG: hypothetical protein WC943_04075 [Elusimicrobiota bacterium]|jgi:hypothetical protein
MSRRAIAASAVLLLASSPVALAWGPAGHEKAALAALEILVDRRHPLAPFLSANAPLLKELSQAPSGALVPGEREDATHFFKVDAFMAARLNSDAIALLPKGEYREVRPVYWQLLGSNADTLRKLAPDRPLLPEAHGTAPWRVLQLQRLSAASLKAENPARALLFLAAMGHHAADLAEPLRSVADLSAGQGAGAAAGVMPAFEDQAASAASDRAIRLVAEKALGSRALKPLPAGEVLSETLSLVKTGYPLAGPLKDSFAQKCLAYRDQFPGACSPEAGALPAALAERFSSGVLAVPGPRGPVKTTVKEAAENRLGEAAALLARLWASAYAEAGSPGEGLGRRFIKTGELDLARDYPSPDYLPEPGAGGPDPGPVSPEEVTPVSAIMADTRRHDGKVLCAAGPATVLFRKTSRKGNSYFTFFIAEGPAKVKVFSFGEPAFKEGEEVEACGRFSYEKRVSGRLFFNQISAESILRGKAMRSGSVLLTESGVLPVRN